MVLSFWDIPAFVVMLLPGPSVASDKQRRAFIASSRNLYWRSGRGPQRSQSIDPVLLAKLTEACEAKRNSLAVALPMPELGSPQVLM